MSIENNMSIKGLNHFIHLASNIKEFPLLQVCHIRIGFQTTFVNGPSGQTTSSEKGKQEFSRAQYWTLNPDFHRRKLDGCKQSSIPLIDTEEKQ
jgi:hypothetical protein